VHVRHCVACRTDYRPEIAVCADCGEPLVDRDDELENEDQARGTPSDGLPEVPAGFEPLFTAGHVYDLTPLADRLVAAEIDFRFRERRHADRVVGYRLLVHVEDHGRARAALGGLLGDRTGVAVAPAPSEGGEGAAHYDRCPACDTPVRSGTTECSECGLQIGEAQPTCPQCGRVLTDDETARCAGCGQVLSADD
jgi:hypothetical protein